MASIGDLLTAPLFTVMQATGNGLLLIGLVPVLSIAWLVRPREPKVQQRLWWLLALAAPWVLLAVWTRLNWHSGEYPTDVSQAATIMAYGTMLLTLAGGIAATVWLKGARIVAMIAGAVNLYLATIGGLLCVMATSGNWI